VEGGNLEGENPQGELPTGNRGWLKLAKRNFCQKEKNHENRCNLEGKNVWDLVWLKYGGWRGDDGEFLAPEKKNWGHWQKHEQALRENWGPRVKGGPSYKEDHRGTACQNKKNREDLTGRWGKSIEREFRKNPERTTETLGSNGKRDLSVG